MKLLVNHNTILNIEGTKSLCVYLLFAATSESVTWNLKAKCLSHTHPHHTKNELFIKSCYHVHALTPNHTFNPCSKAVYLEKRSLTRQLIRSLIHFLQAVTRTSRNLRFCTSMFAQLTTTSRKLLTSLLDRQNNFKN